MKKLLISLSAVSLAIIPLSSVFCTIAIENNETSVWKKIEDYMKISSYIAKEAILNRSNKVSLDYIQDHMNNLTIKDEFGSSFSGDDEVYKDGQISSLIKMLFGSSSYTYSGDVDGVSEVEESDAISPILSEGSLQSSSLKQFGTILSSIFNGGLTIATLKILPSSISSGQFSKQLKETENKPNTSVIGKLGGFDKDGNGTGKISKLKDMLNIVGQGIDFTYLNDTPENTLKGTNSEVLNIVQDDLKTKIKNYLKDDNSTKTTSTLISELFKKIFNDSGSWKEIRENPVFSSLIGSIIMTFSIIGGYSLNNTNIGQDSFDTYMAQNFEYNGDINLSNVFKVIENLTSVDSTNENGVLTKSILGSFLMKTSNNNQEGDNNFSYEILSGVLDGVMNSFFTSKYDFPGVKDIATLAPDLLLKLSGTLTINGTIKSSDVVDFLWGGYGSNADTSKTSILKGIYDFLKGYIFTGDSENDNELEINEENLTNIIKTFKITTSSDELKEYINIIWRIINNQGNLWKINKNTNLQKAITQLLDKALKKINWNSLWNGSDSLNIFGSIFNDLLSGASSSTFHLDLGNKIFGLNNINSGIKTGIKSYFSKTIGSYIGDNKISDLGTSNFSKIFYSLKDLNISQLIKSIDNKLSPMFEQIGDTKFSSSSVSNVLEKLVSRNIKIIFSNDDQNKLNEDEESDFTDVFTSLEKLWNYYFNSDSSNKTKDVTITFKQENGDEKVFENVDKDKAMEITFGIDTVTDSYNTKILSNSLIDLLTNLIGTSKGRDCENNKNFFQGLASAIKWFTNTVISQSETQIEEKYFSPLYDSKNWRTSSINDLKKEIDEDTINSENFSFSYKIWWKSEEQENEYTITIKFDKKESSNWVVSSIKKEK